MEEEKRDFDKVAARWDDDPGRVRAAREVGDAIAAAIALAPSMDVLDFGCGTGLLTLKLQPLVRTVTGVDSSGGMLERLAAKIERLGICNVTPLLRDLDRGDALDGTYDLVTTSMTLHHVKDPGTLLRSFRSVLRPGGWLAVADLDLEGGKFHEDNTGVFHKGFDRSSLGEALVEAGFGEVACRTATSIEKPDGAGGTRPFTVFLMTARVPH